MRHPPICRLAPLLFAGLLLALAPRIVPAAAPVLSDCRLERPGGHGSLPARCGQLSVPENPRQPQGRAIKLRFAIVPALRRTPSPDPLVILAGGPGQAATDFYASTAGAFSRIQRDRDLILLDQRGTGQSQRLDCHYPNELDTGAQDLALLQKLTQDCLAAQSTDVRYYTTSVAVSDLEALRVALGYARWNLYGVSYGTRVAQHYARRYLPHTRSLILDGVVPPGVALGPDIAVHAEQALAFTLKRCHDDAACHRAFPELDRDYASLRQILASLPTLAQPIAVGLADPVTGVTRREPLQAAALLSAIRLLTYQSATVSLLPLMIHEAAEHRYAPLMAQALLVQDDLESQLAYGMHNSVVCTEDLPFIGRPDRAVLQNTYLGTQPLDGLIALCGIWPRGILDEDLRAPLQSTVPALLLSGEADPVTPPEYGDQAARGFADMKHLVLHGQGHGQLATGCVPRLMAQFIAAGSARKLDLRCAETIRSAPFFIDFNGPAP